VIFHGYVSLPEGINMTIDGQPSTYPMVSFLLEYPSGWPALTMDDNHHPIQWVDRRKIHQRFIPHRRLVLCWAYGSSDFDVLIPMIPNKKPKNPLVMCQIAVEWTWPSRNSWISYIKQMVDLSIVFCMFTRSGNPCRNILRTWLCVDDKLAWPNQWFFSNLGPRSTQTMVILQPNMVMVFPCFSGEETPISP
jgi:hypothetical protein